MALKYFLKNGVKTRITDKNFQNINFTPIADGRGVIEVDDSDKKNAPLVEALGEYVARRIGGVVSITAAEFKDLKKNQPFQPKVKEAPKLLLQERDPFRKGGAQAAKGQVSANPAGVGRTAQDVAGQAAPKPIPAPVSRGRASVRTNRTNTLQSTNRTETPQPPDPSAPIPPAAGQPITAGTTGKP